MESRYKLGEELAKNAMGTIYKATHEVVGREVVLRTLPPELPLTGDVGKRVREVLRRHGQLNHPNILPLTDGDLESTPAYVVMDCLPGGSLRTRLRQKPRPTPSWVMPHLLSVLEALAFGHSKSFLHKDLKPENVLLDGGGTARLADFGLGVLRPPKARIPASSLAYMSPSLYRSPDGHDQRTDLFSLGILLYECLTGELPGRGSRPISEMVNSLPKVLDELFDRLTGKENGFESSAQARDWWRANPELMALCGEGPPLEPPARGPTTAVAVIKPPAEPAPKVSEPLPKAPEPAPEAPPARTKRPLSKPKVQAPPAAESVAAADTAAAKPAAAPASTEPKAKRPSILDRLASLKKEFE